MFVKSGTSSGSTNEDSRLNTPPKLILFDNAQAKSECQFVPNLYGEPA